MDNLSNLVTIPNNILQGQFKKAGENTLRLAINSTIGVLGIFDVANSLGFELFLLLQCYLFVHYFVCL